MSRAATTASRDRLEYRPGTGTYRYRYDERREGSVAVPIVEAVEAVTGIEPTAMEPLYDVLDPDALDAVVESMRAAGTGAVSFAFEGCGVWVHADGTIDVRPPEPA